MMAVFTTVSFRPGRRAVVFRSFGSQGLLCCFGFSGFLTYFVAQRHRKMLQSPAPDYKFGRYLSAEVDSFQLALHEYLRDDIVNILRTDGTWAVGSILHQDVAKKMLDNVMWWLFDDEPEKSLLHLEQLNNPQHICGRVFKPGEPTYSCRDCAMDPTCVFCQQCFWNSEHQKHRYKADMDDGGGMCDCGDEEAFANHKRCSIHQEEFMRSKQHAAEMHTSAGGGCCDCGDVEAWHHDHACRLHTHDQDMETELDAVSRLPLKVRERAPFFFNAILSYIVDFLTTEKTAIADLESSLQPSEKSDSFVTMLFNDELHTFDFVIDVLKKALKCNDALGADFATIVDREGRSVVCIDNEEKCEEVKKIVGTPPTPYFSFRTNEPLKTAVIHASIIAHQEMALLILPMLSRIVQQSEGLRKIFCEVALKETITAIPPVVGTSGSGKMSPVEQLMRCDHELWKTARNHYLQLLMNSLLLDVETKKLFGVLFTRLYQDMQDGFVKGDHDHSQSVTSLAVQLFTVPTVARHLIVSEDVIGMILRALAKLCYGASNLHAENWCQIYKINTKRMRAAMRRAHYSFFDLRYILAILPDQWTLNLKNKFVEGMKMFLQILMAMQGMDAVVRKTDRHIEHEPDWETGTTVVMRFHSIIHHVLQWLSTDVDLLFIALKLCLQALNVLNEAGLKRGETIYGSTSYSCIEFDITKQPVSTQYPVSRFTAAVLVELGKLGITWDEIKRNGHVAPFVEHSMVSAQLMECSLRCLCLSAQVNSGLWRRNGLSLVNQLIYYKEYRCRQEAFERDIQMLQICAGNMDPNHFIAILLHKIQLNPEPEHFIEHHVSITSEFFRILIAVCGERFIPGVSDITAEQQIRRQIVQILAVEPKPHSKIVKQLSETISDKLAWEDLLHQVADFQEPATVSSVGRYILKPSSISEFSPYSYHYTSATEETKAQQEIVRRKKALQWSTVFVPPKLPKFSKLLSTVSNILCCDVFILYLSNFLQQLTTGNHEQWSDRLVDKALYLIAMAIVENEQQLEMDPQTDFNFAKKAVSGCESSILFLLKQLQVTESLVIHRETIRWLIVKIERLTNQRGGTSSSVDPESMIQSDEPLRENQDSVRNVRKRKAQELRDKLLTQMKVLQQNFLSQNPDLVSEQSMESTSEMSQEPTSSQEITSPVCTELPWQVQALRTPEPTHTCILCQEETSPADGSLVMSAFVQRSTVLTRGPRDELNIEQYAPLFVDLTFPNGIHTSTCSHTMHYDCFKAFRESVNNTEARRRHHRYSRRSFDTTANEFLCPLCSRISNTVLPVIPRAIVAKQRGISVEDDDSEGTNVDRPMTSASPTGSEDTPSMKSWLKSIEEMLRPVVQEAQEVVIRFHADVTCLDEEMEKAELAGEEETSQSLEETVQELTKVHDIPTSDAKPVENPLPEGLQNALNEYLQTVQTVGLNGDVSEIHRPLTSWLTVSTTFTCSEMISRLNETVVLANSPVRVSSALGGVTRAAFAMSATCSEEYLSDIRKYARKLLSALIGEDTDERFPILNCNIFSVFIHLWFSSAVLRRSRQIDEFSNLKIDLDFEKNILHLCTLAQIVQIFLNMDVENLAARGIEEQSSLLESSSIFQAFKQVRSIANLPPIPTNITEELVTSAVELSLKPFIRCCALFLHQVTGVPAPDSLNYKTELKTLLKYLGLPKHLTELFDVAGKLSLEPLIQKWISNPAVMASLSTLPRHLSYPTVSHVPTIVPFPDDYSDLIGAAATFRCPKFASEDSLYPTMCLICGLMLCSQSYCCQKALPEKNQQVGACTFHARSCGAGSGMFLRVREATIVLLNGVYRGCFIPAPYLDKHGEADKGLRRGNPLYLNQPRLLELRKLWLSHGIAERVSHDIEARSMGGILDWAHL